MKTRLDVFLVNKGLIRSRERAKQLIREGRITVDGKIVTKASEPVSDEADITVAENADKYVSRGAYKLKHAIEYFDIDLAGQTCIDIGASTGGFTQVMLENGAARVYAVDVGHDQLDESLRQDERVVSMEGVNFRYFDVGQIDETIDFAAVDVSFISLEHILGKAYEVLKNGAGMVCLIKPQFEAGRKYVGKHGIVSDKKVHNDVIDKISEHCSEAGFKVMGLTESPVKGGDGNTEYLVYIIKQG